MACPSLFTHCCSKQRAHFLCHLSSATTTDTTGTLHPSCALGAGQVSSAAMASNTIDEATVRLLGWYNEFSTGNRKLVEACLDWGAHLWRCRRCTHVTMPNTASADARVPVV